MFSSIICLNGQKPQMGGASTGEAKTYTSKRTTGIVDEKAAKIYEDVTANTALKSFRCVSGGAEKNYIIETTACTVAVFDYDNDGKPDIYLLNGSTMNAERGKEKAAKPALLRNTGNWKFFGHQVSSRFGRADDSVFGLGNAVFRFR
jgi:enediyne biosynthesis protein E4